jgi:hypothetical protein
MNEAAERQNRGMAVRFKFSQRKSEACEGIQTAKSGLKKREKFLNILATKTSVRTIGTVPRNWVGQGQVNFCDF